MKPVVNLFALAPSVIVPLLVLGSVAVNALLNLEKIRADFAAKVKAQTGRELVISGQVNLTFVFGAGVDLGLVELANATDSGKHFLLVTNG